MIEVKWDTVDGWVRSITSNIVQSEIKYDVIVGIGRGGLIPATIFSHQLGVPLVPVIWQTRDGDEAENLTAQAILFGTIARINQGGKILLVDDISDSGKTIFQVFDFLDKTQFDLKKSVDIDTATLVQKPSSKFKPKYCIETVDDNEWVVFPWEAE